MMNSNTTENYGHNDKNFQNEDTSKKGQQKTSSTGHSFTENAEPDYGSDLSTREISRESTHNDMQDSEIPNSALQSSDPNGNPYDSENLDHESDSESKDITEKDIEEDLINNDPSEGFETEIDTSGSDEAESDSFKTIEPDQDNPVNREFEIGQLGNEELREDERTRDETGNAAYHNKPSQRKF
jgi:hypothetical protein